MPAGSPGPSSPQGMVGRLGRHGMLLAHVQLAVRQNTQDLFLHGCSPASLHLVSTCIASIDLSQFQSLALALKRHAIANYLAL